MSIVEKVRSWLSPKSPEAEADGKLRALLRAAVVIVSAYGDVLERSGGPPLSIKRSETTLPFSKEQIKKAIAVLQVAARQPRLRTILVELLSPVQAQQILSSRFEQSLEAGLLMLEDFVTPAEAEADQKQWDELLRIVGENDPATLERILRAAETHGPR